MSATVGVQLVKKSIPHFLPFDETIVVIVSVSDEWMVGGRKKPSVLPNKRKKMIRARPYVLMWRKIA